MALHMMLFPPGAEMVKVTPRGVFLEAPEPVAPMPLPMPTGERRPDWRWRKLVAAVEGVSSRDVAAMERNLADDDWLREVILPCYLHHRDRSRPGGAIQLYFQGAVGLVRSRRELRGGRIKTHDIYRLLDCGILAGIPPDQYPGVGPAIPLEERKLYELLFFDVRGRRDDRAWIEDVVFRSLCGSVAFNRLDLLWLQAAWLLPTAEFVRAVEQVSPITGLPFTMSWLRLQQRTQQAEALAAELEKLGVSATLVADRLAEWLTEPLADADDEAVWESVLPPPRKPRSSRAVPGLEPESVAPSTSGPATRSSTGEIVEGDAAIREAPPTKKPRRPRGSGSGRLPSGVKMDSLPARYDELARRLEGLLASTFV